MAVFGTQVALIGRALGAGPHQFDSQPRRLQSGCTAGIVIGPDCAQRSVDPALALEFDVLPWRLLAATASDATARTMSTAIAVLVNMEMPPVADKR